MYIYTIAFHYLKGISNQFDVMNSLAGAKKLNLKQIALIVLWSRCAVRNFIRDPQDSGSDR